MISVSAAVSTFSHRKVQDKSYMYSVFCLRCTDVLLIIVDFQCSNGKLPNAIDRDDFVGIEFKRDIT